MQMGLSRRLGVFDTLFQNILCLFHELAVQVNCVSIDSADRVILSEDILGSLLVILIHHRAMPLALF